MTRTPDASWIETRLTGARPQVMAALLRYFRDLDLAEEAFQEACLRALRNWPEQGPPRDAAAWLIMVGRNAALDQCGGKDARRSCPGDPALRPARMNPTSPSGWTPPITATTSCG
ncbi:MAG: sigma factor [Paracoccus sp. (in: a-proteobacteria)]